MWHMQLDKCRRLESNRKKLNLKIEFTICPILFCSVRCKVKHNNTSIVNLSQEFKVENMLILFHIRTPLASLKSKAKILIFKPKRISSSS